MCSCHHHGCAETGRRFEVTFWYAWFTLSHQIQVHLINFNSHSGKRFPRGPFQVLQVLISLTRGLHAAIPFRTYTIPLPQGMI